MEILLFVLCPGCCWNKKSTQSQIQSENRDRISQLLRVHLLRDSDSKRTGQRPLGPRNVQNTGLLGTDAALVTTLLAMALSWAMVIERQGADTHFTDMHCGKGTMYLRSLQFIKPEDKSKLNWGVPSSELTEIGSAVCDPEFVPHSTFCSLAFLCWTQPMWPNAGPWETKHSCVELRLYAIPFKKASEKTWKLLEHPLPRTSTRLPTLCSSLPLQTNFIYGSKSVPSCHSLVSGDLSQYLQIA